MTTSADPWDSITIEQLRAIGGRKWSHFPDAIGSFIAESDFGAAPAITEAMQRVVDTAYYGYNTPALTAALRKATSSWLRDAYGWEVPPLNVRRLPDVLSGLEVTLQYYTHSDTSKIILPTPAYMPFLTIPGTSWKRETIQVPLVRRHDRWELDYDGIAAAFDAGGEVLVLVNPHNPTGRVYTCEELERVAEVVDAAGGRVFADEIHAPLVYAPNRHIPYASVNETAAGHTITATSASKAWNLPGLKTAQLILSNDADADVWKRVGYWPEDGAGTLGVIANTVAYNDSREWLARLVAYLDRNRLRLAELVAEELPRARFETPEGTYLAWVDLREYHVPEPLSVWIRRHAGVAVTDGLATGEPGRGWARLNFATPLPILERTVRQIGAALRDQG